MSGKRFPFLTSHFLCFPFLSIIPFLFPTFFFRKPLPRPPRRGCHLLHVLLRFCFLLAPNWCFAFRLEKEWNVTLFFFCACIGRKKGTPLVACSGPVCGVLISFYALGKAGRTALEGMLNPARKGTDFSGSLQLLASNKRQCADRSKPPVTTTKQLREKERASSSCQQTRFIAQLLVLLPVFSSVCQEHRTRGNHTSDTRATSKNQTNGTTLETTKEKKRETAKFEFAAASGLLAGPAHSKLRGLLLFAT